MAVGKARAAKRRLQEPTRGVPIWPMVPSSKSYTGVHIGLDSRGLLLPCQDNAGKIELLYLNLRT